MSESNGQFTTDIIQTTDEEGQVHVFEKVDEIEVEGKPYVLMLYLGDEETWQKNFDASNADGDPDSDEGYDEEVVVMAVAHEDGLEVYEAIEDEDEFNRVVAHVEKMVEDSDEYVLDIGDLLTDAVKEKQSSEEEE